MRKIKKNLILSSCLIFLIGLGGVNYAIANSNESQLTITGDLVPQQKENYQEEIEKMPEPNAQKETIQKVQVPINERRLPKTGERNTYVLIFLGGIFLLISLWVRKKIKRG